MNEVLKDRQGKLSSKRIAGFALVSLAVLMSMVLFVFSLWDKAEDADTAIRVVEWLLISGGGLLGIGIFERLKK